MEDKGFLGQLRALAVKLDRDIAYFKGEIDKTEKEFCYPVVMKNITDLSRESKGQLVCIFLLSVLVYVSYKSVSQKLNFPFSQ